MNIQKMPNIKKGDKCPDFSLLNQDGVLVHLNSFIGRKNVVLFFYPKDNSLGCRVEACCFRDNLPTFEGLDCVVVGVSSGSVLSHKDFSEKYNLKYDLLSDVDDELRNTFGLPRSYFGLIKGRLTFVIDKEGIIQFVFNSQSNVYAHVKKAIAVLQKNQ